MAEARLSPDGARVAYTVREAEGPGRPSSRAFVLELATGRSRPLPGEPVGVSTLRWSPDGRSLAALGPGGRAWGLLVVRDGGPGPPRLLAPVRGTNHPLPSTADPLAWSPDGQSIVFVSSTPGPEPEANGDPRVITRYLYKPTAGRSDFNDNRRLHLFLVEVSSGRLRQLTDGPYHDHSPAWSPRGDEIAFLSNREADPDRVFNYDLFAVRVADGAIRRLTATPSAEYAPAWSPDGRYLAFLGTKRPLTSSETTMEDVHVWVMSADGSERREVGAAIDNRQGEPRWSADGRSLVFTVQEAGDVRLYRLPVDGGRPEPVAPAAGERGIIGDWSQDARGTLAYALASPSSPSELHVGLPGAARPATRLNDELMATRAIAPVEPFSFESFDGTRIEAFLTLPHGRRAGSRHPLVVAIHGGPHAQQGPAFNLKAQAYAREGWATLMVNYRGSTGYGQRLADAIFGDQNGGEAQDVLAGVDAALARHPWLDPARLGIEGTSYGGQLTNWIITRTDRFRAAIPTAGISNLVSFNYMAYYHDYLAVEFGSYPHEGDLMDVLWQRSPLRHVARVKTPTLFLHGEEDNDVPIAEAEQLYVALKDVGVEAVMVRYPREGHGLRETAHVVDALARSIEWYRRHFAGR